MKNSWQMWNQPHNSDFSLWAISIAGKWNSLTFLVQNIHEKILFQKLFEAISKICFCCLFFKRFMIFSSALLNGKIIQFQSIANAYFIVCRCYRNWRVEGMNGKRDFQNIFALKICMFICCAVALWENHKNVDDWNCIILLPLAFHSKANIFITWKKAI